LRQIRLVRKARTDKELLKRGAFYFLQGEIMRNRSIILRNLIKENLDPKVAYVLGKNGKLVPKGTKETRDLKSTQEAMIEASPKEKESEEFILPEGAKSIPESLAENVEITSEPAAEKLAVNKKKSSTKKKTKIEATAE